MEFKQALEAMKQGVKVKLPSWAGFWQIEGNRIKMHCKDGKVIDFQDTDDIFYTLGNLLHDDWEIVEDESKVANLDIQTFGFGEAIRNMRAGKQVARKGWNGKGMFIFIQPTKVFNMDELHCDQNELDSFLHVKGTDQLVIGEHINMKAADGSIVVGWLASQTDMLAMDWYVVE